MWMKIFLMIGIDRARWVVFGVSFGMVSWDWRKNFVRVFQKFSCFDVFFYSFMRKKGYFPEYFFNGFELTAFHLEQILSELEYICMGIHIQYILHVRSVSRSVFHTFVDLDSMHDLFCYTNRWSKWYWAYFWNQEWRINKIINYFYCREWFYWK